MRKLEKMIGISVLLLLPIASFAQESLVTPMSLDFGQIPVGESATISVTITGIDQYTPLCVYNLYFVMSPDDPPWGDNVYNQCVLAANRLTQCSNPSAEVTITRSIPDPAPDDLWQFDQLVLEVTYTPAAVGPVPVSFFDIESNDHDQPYIFLPITGEGVEPIPDPETPAELVDDILALFDDAIEMGTIDGTGRCDRVRELRLKTMRLFLAAAERHIVDNRIRAACRALQWAKVGSDGIALDWIEGEDAATLNTLIVSLMETLECGG